MHMIMSADSANNSSFEGISVLEAMDQCNSDGRRDLLN